MENFPEGKKEGNEKIWAFVVEGNIPTFVYYSTFVKWNVAF